MKIFIKTLTGKTVTLEVENNTSVNEIKDQLGWEGISFNDIKLVFEGKHIHGVSTVEELGISENSVVDLVTAVKGGAATTMDPAINELAKKYIMQNQICRGCYAHNHLKARVCRKRRCGHNPDLRPKKDLKKG